MMIARSMRADDSVRGAKLRRGTARRVLSYTAPYRWQVVGFVVVIVLGALLALVPPLALRTVLDDAIPNSDRRLLNVLGVIVVGAALAEAGLSFAERWWS